MATKKLVVKKSCLTAEQQKQLNDTKAKVKFQATQLLLRIGACFLEAVGSAITDTGKNVHRIAQGNEKTEIKEA